MLVYNRAFEDRFLDYSFPSLPHGGFSRNLPSFRQRNVVGNCRLFEHIGVLIAHHNPAVPVF
jgi:hypothetical protein